MHTCDLCSGTGNTACLQQTVLPLLRGALAAYAGYVFTDPQDGLLHLADVGWDSSTAPKGVQLDNSWNMALLTWACRAFAELLPVGAAAVGADGGGRAPFVARGDEDDDPDPTLHELCRNVSERLAPLPRDPANGALLVARFQNGTGIGWNQLNQMGVSLVAGARVCG